MTAAGIPVGAGIPAGPSFARFDVDARLDLLEEAGVNVRRPDFGAEGDGVTDDTTAFERAAVTGLPVYVPPGVYRLTRTPFLGAVPLCLFGLDRRRTIIDLAGKNLAQLSGSIGASIAVTATVAAGATTLPLASTSGLAAGDDLILRDTNQVLSGTGASPYAGVVGEVVRIKSVDSSTVVTIWGAVEQAMTLTAGNLTVRKITPVDGVTVAGLTIRNPNPSTYLGGDARALQLTRCRNVDISDVIFSQLDDDGVNLDSCVDWRVANCGFDNLQNTGGRTPYGVLAGNASVNGLVHACRQNGGRHLFTTGGDDGEIGPAHILVADSQAWHSTTNPFDTHPAGREIDFADCQAHACLGGGFHLRSPRSRIKDAKVLGGAAAAGITLGGSATGSSVEGGEVRGVTTCVDVQANDCEVQRVKAQGSAYGVRVRGTVDLGATPLDKVRVRNIDVVGNPSVGGVVLNGTDTTTRIVERISAPDATTPISPARAMDLEGAGTPEGNVAAGVGSTYRRRNGGAGTSFYVKESGTGNTGWTAK